MVKNGPNSLRSSVSSISLRTSALDQVARQRATELQEENYALKRQLETLSQQLHTSPASPPAAEPLQTSRPLRDFDPELNPHIDSAEMGGRVPLHELSKNQPIKEDVISLDGVPAEMRSLFQKYNDSMAELVQQSRGSLPHIVPQQHTLKSPEAYTRPFCDFLTDNPTVWHTVAHFEKRLDAAGFKKVLGLVPY